MLIDDTAGADSDAELDGVLVVFNASPDAATVGGAGDGGVHPLTGRAEPYAQRWAAGVKLS